MIIYKGGKYSPKKGDRGWFIANPFIIIGKEFAYDESLDYEGFVIKKITDKKGKKIPIIGLKVHDCSDLKCEETCNVCGKSRRHCMEMVEAKPHHSHINIHTEHYKCSVCGHEEERDASHDYISILEVGHVLKKCLTCGKEEKEELSGIYLIILSEEPSRETLLANFGSLIKDIKEMYPLLKEYVPLVEERERGDLEIPEIVKFLRGEKLYFEKGWEKDTYRYFFHKDGKIFEEVTRHVASESLSPDEMGYREVYGESSQRIREFGNSIVWILENKFGRDWREKAAKGFQIEKNVRLKLKRLEELTSILSDELNKRKISKEFRFPNQKFELSLYDNNIRATQKALKEYERFLEYIEEEI